MNKKWLFLSLLGVIIALSLSALLYDRSRGIDPAQHAAVTTRLAEVRRLQAQFGREVLLSRTGFLNQYDTANSTLERLRRAAEPLGPEIAQLVGNDSDLQAKVAAAQVLIAEEQDLWEEFKGKNSILRNSVYYLPTAREEVAATGAFREALQQYPTLNDTTWTAGEAALKFSMIGGEANRQNLTKAIEALEAPEFRELEDLQLYRTHLRVVERTQGEVDALITQLARRVDSEVIPELGSAYSNRVSGRDEKAQVYRRWLYGWSLLLLGLILITGYQLFKLYRELESRVEKRTEELKDALDRLWSEMELAKKIQQALVPHSPHLDGCDVAARMVPAEQVGGDYYDVVHTGSREWIFVGDVSGHGVPAGLVMMMCQTAIRTALAGDEDIDPAELLSVVNDVLYDNIQSLGEDKYMTLTALRREPNGKVSFAGAHQDILILRGGNHLEVIPTEGMWLGVMRDIPHKFRTSELTLEPGDTLVLFTDGITEAVHEGSMLEPEGLARILEKTSGSPQEVIDSTFGQLATYDVDDDATIIAVKVETASEPNPPSPAPQKKPSGAQPKVD